jgi:hypothetical protein
VWKLSAAFRKGTSEPTGDLGRVFSQVELRGLEPLTPCLQSDVFTRDGRADLVRQLSVSDRHVPLLTLANGTLMARDLGTSACSMLETVGEISEHAVSALRASASGAYPAHAARVWRGPVSL